MPQDMDALPPPAPIGGASSPGSAILAMIGAAPSSPSPGPMVSPTVRPARGEDEASLSLKGLLGVLPPAASSASYAAPPADGAGAAAPSGAGANVAASNGLKGLIGISVDASAVFPPPPPPGAGNSAGAAAGAQILGMLGVVKGDAAAAGPGVGPAASDSGPPPPLPAMPLPVPPAEPPSPGAAILSMLKRDFPPPVAGNGRPPLPPAPTGATALLSPGYIAAASGPPAPPLVTPGQLASSSSPPMIGVSGGAAAASNAGGGPGGGDDSMGVRRLLAASVSRSMGGTGDAATGRMSLQLFKQVTGPTCSGPKPAPVTALFSYGPDLLRSYLG